MKTSWVVVAGVVLAGALAVTGYLAIDARRERDDARKTLAERDRAITRACSATGGMAVTLAHQLETEGSVVVRSVNDFFLFGPPLFGLCGVELDPVAGAFEDDPAELLTMTRAVRDALDHWR